jgi:hypothetical protein
MITNTVKERTLKNRLKSQVFCNITENILRNIVKYVKLFIIMIFALGRCLCSIYSINHVQLLGWWTKGGLNIRVSVSKLYLVAQLTKQHGSYHYE